MVRQISSTSKASSCRSFPLGRKRRPMPYRIAAVARSPMSNRYGIESPQLCRQRSRAQRSRWLFTGLDSPYLMVERIVNSTTCVGKYYPCIPKSRAHLHRRKDALQLCISIYTAALVFMTVGCAGYRRLILRWKVALPPSRHARARVRYGEVSAFGSQLRDQRQ